ncbi:hypothetical protein Dimus_033495 [Dionaea muscipula]
MADDHIQECLIMRLLEIGQRRCGSQRLVIDHDLAQAVSDHAAARVDDHAVPRLVIDRATTRRVSDHAVALGRVHEHLAALDLSASMRCH